MEYVEDVHALYHILDTDDPETAERFLAAFLETLGERLPRDEQERLASQLPDGMKPIILKHLNQDYFDREEFYSRIAARSGIGTRRTIRWANKCGAYFVRRLTPEIIDHTLSYLGPDFREVFYS